MKKTKLRIIHCFRNPIGGIFRHIRDLAQQQAADGHDVGILCDSTTGGSFEDALFDEIRPNLSLGLTRIPIDRSISIRDVGALYGSYKEIKSLKPDVLHGHGAKGGAMSRIIGSLLRVNRYRVARIYSPHGGSLHFSKQSATGRSILRLERMLEYGTDAIVFVCGYERSVYEAKIGKPRCRSEVIYNGIGDAEFEPVPTVTGAADFLYIGMLRDLKGPDLFVTAFAKTERLLKRPLTALMIGDGPDRDKYKTMMLELGLGQRIQMLPATPARNAFAYSPTIVVPSRAEAMPYIVLEALAAGKTVVCSRVGGIPEVLGADSEALVNVGDADDMARVMAKTIYDPSWSARTMPDRDELHRRFSSGTMASQIMNVYRTILAR